MLVALVGLSLAPLRAAEVEFSAPNWSAPAAYRAAAAADANAVLAPLFEHARRGEDRQLLLELNTLAGNEQLALPARERILFEFAQGLGELAPDAVGSGVIAFLLGYAPRTLVPHPDNAGVGIPQFNVRGATAGSLNAWQRRAGYESAMALFAGGEADVAREYLRDLARASPPRRLGMMDALPAASTDQLAAITEWSLARPSGDALNALAGRSALLLGDTTLLRGILAAGRGPEVSHLLAEAAERLDEPGRIDLLFGLLTTAAPANAALAIATLAPGLLHHPEVAERLFGLMNEPDLGSAAALALSASGRTELRERLRDLATGEGLSSRRAAIALDATGGNSPKGVR